MAIKLTQKTVEALAPGATVYDSITTGLVARCTGPGKGSWSVRYMLAGKRREKSLGGWPRVSLAVARESARDVAKLLKAGVDPVQSEREAARAATDAATAAARVLTFERAARILHADLAPGFRNAKHVAQWISTLETYVFPTLGGKALAAITPADCAEALRPIWLAKSETASRTRQRMHAVLQWAWAHGYIAANPVAVVDHLLPTVARSKDHHPAMPWRQAPAFVGAHLQGTPDTVGGAALLFAILTAARSGEVRGATWNEFDLESGVWTVPGARMKARKPHRVPLAAQALALLRSRWAAQLAARDKGPIAGDLVFPAPRGGALSDMALTALLRRAKAPSATPGRIATPHGFRSAWRDWASENGYSRDLAERALAHVIANQVEAAYHRTDLLEQRAPMMQHWADFVLPLQPLAPPP